MSGYTYTTNQSSMRIDNLMNLPSIPFQTISNHPKFSNTVRSKPLSDITNGISLLFSLTFICFTRVYSNISFFSVPYL